MDQTEHRGRASFKDKWIDDQDDMVYISAGFGSHGGSNLGNEMDNGRFYPHQEFTSSTKRRVRRLRSAKARLVNPLFAGGFNYRGPKFCLDRYDDCREFAIKEMRHGRGWTILPHNFPSDRKPSFPQKLEHDQDTQAGDSGGPLMKIQAPLDDQGRPTKDKRYYIVSVLFGGTKPYYIFRTYDQEFFISQVPMIYEPLTCELLTI